VTSDYLNEMAEIINEAYAEDDDNVIPLKADAVNRPQHYTKMFGALADVREPETIDVVELIVDHYPASIAGHMMQALQYQIRAPHKHEDMLEDLKKAEWYIRRAINRLSRKRH
jgi:hypothetical protein